MKALPSFYFMDIGKGKAFEKIQSFYIIKETRVYHLRVEIHKKFSKKMEVFEKFCTMRVMGEALTNFF